MPATSIATPWHALCALRSVASSGHRGALNLGGSTPHLQQKLSAFKSRSRAAALCVVVVVACCCCLCFVPSCHWSHLRSGWARKCCFSDGIDPIHLTRAVIKTGQTLGRRGRFLKWTPSAATMRQHCCSMFPSPFPTTVRGWACLDLASFGVVVLANC